MLFDGFDRARTPDLDGKPREIKRNPIFYI
jgi:hypothetical protein